VWEADGTGDIGRIERQNVVIEALIDKAKSTYNPITLNAFIGSVVNDVRIGGLSSDALLSLALKYHGFSGSNLSTNTIPTYSAGSAAGSVQVVDMSQAQTVISQFLGKAPDQVTTPPLDAYGSPLAEPTTSGATDAAKTSAASPSRPAIEVSAATTSGTPIPSYDPRPC
jgi:polyisoprenyl-teichoic acid--peptidoglycan teichoic acid transferase